MQKINISLDINVPSGNHCSNREETCCHLRSLPILNRNKWDYLKYCNIFSQQVKTDANFKIEKYSKCLYPNVYNDND